MRRRRAWTAAGAVVGLIVGGGLAGAAQAAAAAPVKPATAGVYDELINSHSVKCADVSGASTALYADIHQWTCEAGTNQLWAAEPVGDPGGIVELRNLNSQLCMTADQPDVDGQQIFQRTCDQNDTDEWWLPVNDGGYFKLVHVSSGKCLDLNNGSTSDGAKIQLWDCSTASNAQDWFYS